MTILRPMSDKPVINNPELCRLAVQIGDDAIDAVVTSRVTDNSLVWRHIPLDPADTDHLKAVENAIYDNTWLLADYGSVNVLVDTDRIMLFPAEHADADSIADDFAEVYPNDDIAIITTRLGRAEGAPVAAVAIDAPLAAFINRTFNNPAVTAPLIPLATYFGIKKHLGNSGKLHVHLAQGRTTVIAYAGTRLLMANTFRVNTATDSLYYVLAAARWLNFDTDADSMPVSGDAKLRDELMPMLRRYVTSAMPLIFPAALFKAGKDAMLAPFQLVLLPLID